MSNKNPEAAEAAKTETPDAPVDTAKVGAPTQTPNDTISDLLPENRIARSAALKIVRDQDIKCSQERMTIIMEGKYGAAPSQEEKAKERAEAKAVKEAAREKAREEKKAEREAKAKEKAEAKAKVETEKAEAKAKVEEAKAAKTAAQNEKADAPKV